MAWDALTNFVERAVAAGVGRARIAEVLEQAGWRSARIQSVMQTYAESDLPVAVPRPAIGRSARELFLYLLVFTALYMAVTGLGTILYQLINLAFPDPSDRYGYFMWMSEPENKLRSGTATLAVFLPTYLWLDHRIEALMRTDPGEAASNVRRKLTYLTLYVTVVVLLCDLGYFIDSWLSGELGRRVLLKCLVVACLGGLVLGRYLHEMNADEHFDAHLAPKVRKATLGILMLASLAAMAAALLNVPSPGAERKRQSDDARENALSQIDAAIMTYYRAYKKLPESLTKLGAAQHVRFPRDPETGKPYRYERKGARNYVLCTSFHKAKTMEEQMAASGIVYAVTSTFVEHPAGNYCFPKEVEPAQPMDGMGAAETVPVPVTTPE